MPHINLQYSENIKPPDFKTLFSAIHRIMNRIANIEINNCKSRAIGCSEYFIGEGEPAGAFVHLEVKMLEGRTSKMKSDLGKTLLRELENSFLKRGDNPDLQLTVEIGDIKNDAYFKFPSH